MFRFSIRELFLNDAGCGDRGQAGFATGQLQSARRQRQPSVTLCGASMSLLKWELRSRIGALEAYRKGKPQMLGNIYVGEEGELPDGLKKEPDVIFTHYLDEESP